MRHRPMGARQTAAFWIEHVLQYGGEHLKPTSMQLAVLLLRHTWIYFTFNSNPLHYSLVLDTNCCKISSETIKTG